MQILHISDLHFQGDSAQNPVLRRAEGLGNLVASYLEGEGLIVAITGDVAHAGRPEQYEAATTFFADLLRPIRARTAVHVVAVPGNHDLDHSEGREVREIVMNTMKSSTSLSQEVLAALAAPQCAFRTWQAQISGIEMEDRHPAFHVHELRVGPLSVRVVGLNTAIFSRLKEEAGTLLFPFPKPDAEMMNSADIVVSLQHHPYSWLHPDAARAVRKFHAEHCDIVLSGHEHDAASRTTTEHATGSVIEFVEAAVFQSHGDEKNSAIGLITVDAARRSFSIREIRYGGGLYRGAATVAERDFRRTRRGGSSFQHTDEFADSLDDTGLQYSHPRTRVLRLPEIFVMPDFREMRELLKDRTGGGEHIEGVPDEPSFSGEFRDVVDYARRHKRVFIVAPENSGKTALSRVITRTFRDQGAIPVLLRGQSLHCRNRGSLREEVRVSVLKQFGGGQADAFFAASLERRACILDGYEQVQLSLEQRENVVRGLESLFGIVVILGREDARWAEIASPGLQPAILEYRHVEMAELGFRRRAELVERWYCLGRLDGDAEEIQRDRAKAERHLTDLMVHGTVPPRPVYVLLLLSQIEASTRLDTTQGSQGFLYESLMTSWLVKAGVAGDQIGLYYSYLTELAGLMWSDDTRTLSTEELNEFHARHVSKALLQLDREKTVGVLDRAHLLRNLDGRVEFSQRYQYYYFVARWLSERTESERAKIRVLCRSLHDEESANILLFLAFLSKDFVALEEALLAAGEQYANVARWDPNADREFLDAICRHTRVPQLDISNLSKNRQRALTMLDERPVSAATSEPLEPSKDQLQAILDINSAVKSIRILGQVLRNMAGHPDGTRKVEITRACVDLQRRVLSSFFSLLREHGELIAREMAEYLRRRTGDGGFGDGATADDVIQAMCEMVTFSMTRLVSDSLGAPELQPVFGASLDPKNLAEQLVLLCVEVDHGRTFPEGRILEAYRLTKDHRFVQAIIRRIVYQHFYLYSVPEAVRRRVCDKVGIRVTKLMIAGPTKIG